MELLDLIRAKMSCCACEGTLKTSRYVNLVQLDRQAMWKHPIAGNVFDPDKRPRAVAVLCDACIARNAEAKLAVEWDEETETAKYHAVGELQQLPPLRGEESGT